MTIKCKELTPDLWRDVDKLFGSRGACGGCWCIYWRLQKGENWEESKGRKNKRRFKRLVETGKAHGALAYLNDEVVGWCSFDKRPDYFRLNRARTLQCDDAENVWSIPCFYVKNGFRNEGVATVLLGFSLRALKKRGAKIAEGYPVKPGKNNMPMPAAFAWTGTLTLFQKFSFEMVGDQRASKLRVRKTL